MSTGTIYRYHPNTGEYVGEGEARLSPLDLKRGRIVYLMPGDATAIAPDFAARPPGELINFFWREGRWVLENTAAGKQKITHKVVRELAGKGYLYVAEQDRFFILHRPGDGKYTIVHEYDDKFFEVHFESYEEAIFEIEVLTGKREPPDLDSPVTEEERELSRQRWDDYEKTQREALAALDVKAEEIETQWREGLAAAQEEAAQYVGQMRAVADSEYAREKEFLQEKAAIVEQQLLLQIAALGDRVKKREEKRHLERQEIYLRSIVS